MTDVVKLVEDDLNSILHKVSVGDLEGIEENLNVLAETIIVQAIDRNNEVTEALFDKFERAWSKLATKDGPDKGVRTEKDIEAELRAMTRMLGSLREHPKTSIEPEVALADKQNNDLFAAVKSCDGGSMTTFELKQAMLELGHTEFKDMRHLHNCLLQLERADLVTRARVGLQTLVYATVKGEKYKLAA